MSNVFVRKSGSDSNGGTSKTDAFLTLGKANTSSSNNDQIVIGAGTYREVVTLSHTGQTWLGDVDGVLTGDAGDVVWTAYTTNDKTAPSGSMLVNLNGKNGIAFSNILFIGGTNATASCVGTTLVVTGPSFTRCDFVGSSNGVVNSIVGTTAASGLTYDRCSVLGGGNAPTLLSYAPSASGAAEYDCGAQYLNCVLMGTGSCQGIGHSPGAGTGRAGGGLVFGCTFLIGGGTAVLVNSNSASGQYPLKALGNYIRGFTGVNASAKGTIVEDWNVLDCVTPRTNVPTGPNSVGAGTYAPMIETWHASATGRRTRPFGEPLAGSPLLGFLPVGTKIACGIPGTVADDTTVGTIAWGTASNATTPDVSAYAVGTLTASTTSHYLKATNLGFALPSTATVTRIVARVTGHQSGGTFAQNSINLTKDGTTFVGTDNSASGPVLTGSDGVFEVGGAADLWGSSWAYTDINASTFGVGISFKNTNVSTTCTVSIDYLTIFVEYTDSSIPTEQTQDFRSYPRPAGGSTTLAVGAFERGNTAAKETSTVQAGSTSGKLLGPSYQDFTLAVDATSTVVSVYLYYDGSYGGSTLPSMSVLNGTECGVAAASISQVGADLTWEQVSLTLVPTAKGVVTIRIRNQSTAASGACYFDSFAIA